jgi:hypothetical protein
MTLKIKNWHEFQHYKDRCPPWIKLYRSLLDDIEFLKLCGDSDIGVLIRLWLIASEDKNMNGELPDSETLAVRLHMAFPGRVTRRDIDKVEKRLSALKHWLEHDASTPLHKAEHDAIPETEKETERETEKETEHARERASNVDHDFELFWRLYPKKTGKKAAIKAFHKARKAGLPEIDTLVAIIERQASSGQWKRDNGQYIPNPTTWLNQGRWDDEVTGPQQPREDMHRDLHEWAMEKEMEMQNDTICDSGLLKRDFGMLPGTIYREPGDN